MRYCPPEKPCVKGFACDDSCDELVKLEKQTVYFAIKGKLLAGIVNEVNGVIQIDLFKEGKRYTLSKTDWEWLRGKKKPGRHMRFDDLKSVSFMEYIDAPVIKKTYEPRLLVDAYECDYCFFDRETGEVRCFEEANKESAIKEIKELNKNHGYNYKRLIVKVTEEDWSE